VLEEEERSFLTELVESGLEEARIVLSRHEAESPPLSDSQTLGEAAEDYANLVATQKGRIAAYERLQYLLHHS
jgi:hypothetical protein